MSEDNSRDDDMNDDFSLDDLEDLFDDGSEESEPGGAGNEKREHLPDPAVSGRENAPEKNQNAGSGALSQEEIDALLGGPATDECSSFPGILSQEKIDAILNNEGGKQETSSEKTGKENSTAGAITQAEIDQLLTAVSGSRSESSGHDEDTPDTPPPRRASSGIPVKVYDFMRPDRFSQEHIRAVSLIHEECARNWTNLTDSRFSLPVHFHNVSTDQLTFEEFIRSLPGVSFFAHCRFSAGGPEFVIEFDLRLIELLISRLAGSGRDRIGKRSQQSRLSPLRKAAAELLMTSLLECVTQAWNYIMPCEIVLEKICCEASEISIFHPMEMIILDTVEFQCGNDGFINCVYPFSSLENIRSLLTDRRFISRKYGEAEPSIGEGDANTLSLPDSRFQIFYEYPLEGVTLGQFLDGDDNFEFSVDPDLKGKMLYTPIPESDE